MRPRNLLVFAATLATFTTVAYAKKPRHVLYIIESRGFHHEVVDYSGQVMKKLAADSRAFSIDVSADSHASLNAVNLKNYDAVMFYTTGELPLDEQQKADFMNWLKAGHGFIGVHSATDTFYKWAEYGEMIGGYFDDHPWHAGSTLSVINVDPDFPSQKQWPKEFQWTDEFYQFKNWDPSKLHVLTRLDPDKLDMTKPGIKRTDKFFANSWVKYWGKGRVFYTAFGHDKAVWDNPDFQKQVEMGLRWADGEIKYKVKIP